MLVWILGCGCCCEVRILRIIESHQGSACDVSQLGEHTFDRDKCY